MSDEVGADSRHDEHQPDPTPEDKFEVAEIRKPTESDGQSESAEVAKGTSTNGAISAIGDTGASAKDSSDEAEGPSNSARKLHEARDNPEEEASNSNNLREEYFPVEEKEVDVPVAEPEPKLTEREENTVKTPSIGHTEVAEAACTVDEKQDEGVEEGSAPTPPSVAKSGISSLPRWMVEDANAPPSEELEEQKVEEEIKKVTEASTAATTATDEEANTSASSKQGRGRGRGRPPAKAPPHPVLPTPSQRATRSNAVPATQSTELSSAKAAATKAPAIQAAVEPPEMAINNRPRRSTRTKIDYAHPDTGTVLAEADDEEPGGLNVVRGGGTGRTKGRAGGGGVGSVVTKSSPAKDRKRKADSDSDKEGDDGYDDDGGSDYGSKKKKRGAVKPAVGSKMATRSRGRPPAKGSTKTKGVASSGASKKGKGRGRPAKKGAARGKGRKSSESEGENEDEIEYDDDESEKETSPMEEEVVQPKKQPASAPSSSTKPPPKKRGRPSTRSRNAAKESEEAAL